ncbi:PREDICTED: basic-leucine zipper transcription factor A-like [Rhagoletis zephyria]|uniref:basic-leucine zipper transcription factor A-like n=1 Tax=Rhagoletis zephyria TaxID=28612 RepID=UPI000811690D|nr:PREDICTED: basic-leucine zipper transcription factor A-like [Rhagoletis zephyria]
MANFDIATAVKVIPEFDGNYRSLSQFLGLVDFYGKTLAESQHAVLVNFILATKLTDKVKNRLLTEDRPTTLTDLAQTLQKIYKSNKNALQLHHEITRAQQGNLSVNAFDSKIENLVASMNDIQIAEQGEQNREIIVKLNEQIALGAFKSGLNNPYKSIILAARPSKLNEAIQLAAEASVQSSHAAGNNNVMFMNRTRGSSNRYRQFRGRNSENYSSTGYGRRLSSNNARNNGRRYTTHGQSDHNNNGGRHNCSTSRGGYSNNGNRQGNSGNGVAPGAGNPGYAQRRS